jgi:hypothetical protein
MPAEALVTHFPGVAVDHDSRRWFEGLLEGRLLVNRCGDCGRWHLPPLPRCPTCGSAAVAATEVSGRGTVYSVVVFPAAEAPDEAALVMVELDEQEGLRLTAAWSGPPGEARIGRRVEVAWPEPGQDPFPAFGPARAGENGAP